MVDGDDRPGQESVEVEEQARKLFDDFMGAHAVSSQPQAGLHCGWLREAPDAVGFFWHAGLSGYGIQTAPAVGRLTAALVTGANPLITADELAAIAPGRLLAN